MKSFIDKLAWIYLVDKQILSTRSKGKDIYYIPGGKHRFATRNYPVFLVDLKRKRMEKQKASWYR